MKKFKGKLEGFPKEVVMKILKRQGLTLKDVVDVENQDLYGGFNWYNSKEGHYFWEDVIINHNFERFFEKYPKKKNKKVKKKTTPKKYQVKISSEPDIQTFPKEVFNKILEIASEQGNNKKDTIITELVEEGLVGAFQWLHSDEGYDFWDKIDEGGGFDEFFKMYPKKSKKKKVEAESLSLKEPIFRMNRKGSFSVDHHTSNQCGAEGLNRYEFEITLVLKQELDDEGFIFDHDLIQKAINDTKIYGSCEEMQQQIHKEVSDIVPDGVLLAYECVIKPLDFYIKAYIEYISCSDSSYYGLL